MSHRSVPSSVKWVTVSTWRIIELLIHGPNLLTRERNNVIKGVFPDNPGGIQETNGAGAQVLHLDHQDSHHPGVWDDRLSQVVGITH